VCTSTLPAGATVKKAKVQDPDQKYQVAASVAHTSGYSIGRCRGKCYCSRAMAAAGGAAARGSDVAAAAKATTSPPPASRRGVLMSCPAGGAAHNPGSWKPNYLSDGIKAVAQQLVSFHSKLELVLANFEGEAIEATPFCERLKKDYPTLTITCVLIEGSFPSGYGVSKVVAVKHAPLDEVLWFDCDVLPIRDPDYLFEDPHFQTTGAAFWGDVEGHYHPERVVKLLDSKDVSVATFPRGAWWVRTGFDSGLVLLNKKKAAASLERLYTMASSFQSWSQYTSGDKDLWHLAWMLEGTNFTMIPHIGSVRHFAQEKWYMASQAKYDGHGEIVALHQLWRSIGRYNSPSTTMKIDLRTHPDYYYSREGGRSRPGPATASKDESDWTLMSGDYSAAELFDSDAYLQSQVKVQADLWKY